MPIATASFDPDAAVISTSVIVVSRGRGADLQRCLSGLSRLCYSAYEVVVVTDPEGEAAIDAAGLRDEVKLVPFDTPNISAARNLGIGIAAGDVVAFIDDDAVPEPMWLAHLIAPFADDQVAATGGYVRGRNGISYQWRARTVDTQGVAHALEVAGDAPQRINPPAGHAIKTEGTNMAVRRDWLLRLGGFDEAFQFYLDETDLNRRLMLAGGVTVLVPLAEVHHAYASSPRRRPNRAVTDLFDVGASTAVFLRKHDADCDPAAALAWLRQEQWDRLQRQVWRRLIKRSDMVDVLSSLEAGLQDGQVRDFDLSPDWPAPQEAFRPFASRANGQHVVLSGWIWARRRLMRQATDSVKAGATVSLYLFSPDSRYHRLGYHLPGIWLQRGGLFGRSVRSQRLVRFWRVKDRVAAEINRLFRIRF
ncbi:glycosyltransferase family 2 protein [Thalassobius sp. Cn5-15]|uniref:glycosyltransferase family 2 protein n=1 Tax=Thalassobius sp. Cn5-15 TaxID=2917763 RepID=UPI001EF16389|nr:glycosyltransferase family 2 protein [Thalassobius sp. Cn5-15]MCG7493999.1 glycosyltransferase family 2 protein [Thalassobius sp. Cn5-15]